MQFKSGTMANGPGSGRELRADLEGGPEDLHDAERKAYPSDLT